MLRGLSSFRVSLIRGSTDYSAISLSTVTVFFSFSFLTNTIEKTVLPNLKIFPDRHPKRETPQQKTSPLEAMTMEPRPGENPKKLIEELRSDVVESYRETKDGGCVCVPEHSVSMTGGEGGRGGVINVRVVLPGVGNVKDVDLEVSEVSI